jgi:hypothetical protein
VNSRTGKLCVGGESQTAVNINDCRLERKGGRSINEMEREYRDKHFSCLKPFDDELEGGKQMKNDKWKNYG